MYVSMDIYQRKDYDNKSDGTVLRAIIALLDVFFI